MRCVGIRPIERELQSQIVGPQWGPGNGCDLFPRVTATRLSPHQLTLGLGAEHLRCKNQGRFRKCQSFLSHFLLAIVFWWWRAIAWWARRSPIAEGRSFGTAWTSAWTTGATTIAWTTIWVAAIEAVRLTILSWRWPAGPARASTTRTAWAIKRRTPPIWSKLFPAWAGWSQRSASPVAKDAASPFAKYALQLFVPHPQLSAEVASFQFGFHFRS